MSVAKECGRVLDRSGNFIGAVVQVCATLKEYIKSNYMDLFLSILV